MPASVRAFHFTADLYIAGLGHLLGRIMARITVDDCMKKIPKSINIKKV
jgi:hypothetical protein